MGLFRGDLGAFCAAGEQSRHCRRRRSLDDQYGNLEALAKPQQIAIVVQKEDFLRRDSDVIVYQSWKEKLRKLYAELKPINPIAFSETYPGQQMFHPSYNAAVQHWLFNATGEYQRGFSAIRCLGYAREEERDTLRMHHKYLVFGDKMEGMVMKPRCVVSGSFNLTKNAVRSRENVLVVEDEKICHAYLSEWAQLWCLSERLDWSSPEPVVEEMNMAT